MSAPPPPGAAAAGGRASDPTGSAGLADTALTAYLSALTAVDGTKRVKAHVRTGALDDWLEDRERPKRIHVLALGKAAPAMLWGLVEASVPFEGLGVAPRQRTRPTVDTFRWLDGDHPVPGEASFAAGAALLAWADAFPTGAPLLVLLSGGASSIAEATDGDPADVMAAWRTEWQAGLPIEDLNHRRAARSLLKGGRLGQRLLARTDRIRVWLLADTPPGSEAAGVGSGPLFQEDDPDRIPHTVLCGNGDLVAAAVETLAGMGWRAHRHAARIVGNAEAEVEAFFDALDGLPPEQEVALVAGGEPTVALPHDAPPGGRCQHAALLAARRIAAGASPAVFFAAGSDGIDGTTREAGAWVDVAAWDAQAEDALERFEAHAFLDGLGRTVRTGQSATNVNDLWIALRPALALRPVAPPAQPREPLVVK